MKGRWPESVTEGWYEAAAASILSLSLRVVAERRSSLFVVV